MFSVITNIYDKKTKGPNLMELFKPNAYAEPSTLLFSASIVPQLMFPLISSDCAEHWPEIVQRHLQRLMGDH